MCSLGGGSVVTSAGILKFLTGPLEAGTVALTFKRCGFAGRERRRREGKRSDTQVRC